MSFIINSLPDRSTLVNAPGSDFQTWSGIAGDGNTLGYANKTSSNKLCKCTVANHKSFLRLTQGLSFKGHFPMAGEVVIATDHNPNLEFNLEFTPPIVAVGLDVEPGPVAVNPGQKYRVSLKISDSQTGQVLEQVETDSLGHCHFIGARCDSARLGKMSVSVSVLDANNQPTPVDFGVNRLDMIAQ